MSKDLKQLLEMCAFVAVGFFILLFYVRKEEGGDPEEDSKDENKPS